MGLSMKHKKIVIKIGTSVLARDVGVDRAVIDGLAEDVSALCEKGIKVIIVSSGAIGAGTKVLKLRHVPASLSGLQAAAAIGQNELMRIYGEAFRKRGYITGQILLTQADFDDRARFLNIKYTIDALLAKGAVPIVNENDTVSTEEIKCGDNDRLSSLVTDLSSADALVILSDVDGLYDKNRKVIRAVSDISPEIKKLAGGKTSRLTKGGMVTKIEAAERVASSGADCYIANGRKKNIVSRVTEGTAVCTHFRAKPARDRARKRWIAYSSKAKGRILVDGGAKRALVTGKKSLLSSGIVGKEGNFKAGDVVGITDAEKKEFARGLTNYSSGEIARIKGLKTREIESALGYRDHDEVIHRDNLVILE